MSEEGKNSVFEGAEVWCYLEDYSLWEKAVVRDIGHVSEIGGKIDVHVEVNGERKIIKTKYEEDSVNEYQHVKPRLSVPYGEVKDMDLSALQVVNEPELFECMRQCHAQSVQYHSIGPVLIWINQFDNHLDNFNDRLYSQYYFVDDVRKDILNPSKASAIGMIYEKLMKLRLPCSADQRVNQAVVLLGETGSGKSKAARDLCNHIAYISRKLTKNPIDEGIFQPDVKFFNHVNTILESFGHCETARNRSSSRFSKAIKLSFDEDTGHIKGLMYRSFHLERDRVTTQASLESNFKVFFDVFDDIYFAAQAATRYGIDNLTMFRITPTRPTTPFLPGRSSFKDLSNALNEVAGIPRAQQNTIFGLLAGLLHLGEVEMEQVDNYGDVSTVLSSDPVSVDHMSKALKLLGISLEALLGVISKRKLNFAGNVVEKNLDLHESHAARDSFLCQVYAALFRLVVSRINEGIAVRFSSKQPEAQEQPVSWSPHRNGSTFFPPEVGTEARDDFDTGKNVFAIYDIVGFENLETNTLEQLCMNYANERIFQCLNQVVYVDDKELFCTERIFVTNTSFFDNSVTIRLLDSKSNGIFTICDDQLKLKSSTSDEKLSSILYAQHSNNKMFVAGRTETKNCEFIVKHFAADVKYQIIGFTSSNKIEPVPEILECLQFSSIDFVKDELSFFCDVRTLASSASHLTGLSPRPTPELAASLASQRSPRNMGLEPSSSVRGPNAFVKTPSFRGPPPVLVTGNRRDQFQRAASVSNGGSSFGSSPLSERGGLGLSPRSKGTRASTLTSLTAFQLTEVITELKAADSCFHLCIRPNLTATYPMNFDQPVVLRQLRPYGIVNIVSFYKQTYPHRSDHVSFVNRYSPLAVLCKSSKEVSRDFLTSLWTVRSLGLGDDRKKEWKELSISLFHLLPGVPELHALVNTLCGSNIGVSDPVELVKNGIRVCENFVMMSGLSYLYLNHARDMAIKLIGVRVWRPYRNKRDGVEWGSSMLMGGFVKRYISDKKEETKRNVQLIVKAQALVRRYLVRRRAVRERMSGGQRKDVEDLVLLGVIRAQAVWRGGFTRKMLAYESMQMEECGMSLDEISLPTDEDEEELISLSGLEEVVTVSKEEEVPVAAHIVEVSMTTHIEEDPPITHIEENPPITHKEEESLSNPVVVEIFSPKEVASSAADNFSVISYVSDPLGKNSSLTAAAGKTRGELTRMRSMQSTIESLAFENSRLKRQLQATHAVREDKDDDEKRRELVTKQTSLDSYTPNSVYGGDAKNPFVSRVVVKKTVDYEMYVTRTLKAVEEDLSYLLQPTPFYKFGRSGNVRKTMVVVTPDFQYLSWKPRNGLMKSSKECRVDLRHVWRLVAGQSTPPFEAYKGVSHGPMPPARSFSLIYGFRSLDLCACDEATYDDWFTGLRYILQLFNGDLQEAGLDRQLLRRKWNYMDTKGFGFLSRKEVIKLVASLGIKFDTASFTAALLRSTIGNSTSDEITFSQLDSLVYHLRRRPDLELLWAKILVGYDFSRDVYPVQIEGEFDTAVLHEVIGVPAFKHFWKVSQGRELTNAEANHMIAEGMGEMHQADFPVLSYVGFMKIMCHPKNDAYDPVNTMLSVKDMSHPLHHYYIATSDGTSGQNNDADNDEEASTAQLKPNPYAIAILAGCRALELRCFEERVNSLGVDTDLYVGRDRGDFRITFKETLLHIHRVAFKKSPFPLILLLEINSDLPQQKRAAKLLTKVFGSAIFTPAEVEGRTLPSPNELRNRVVIFLIHHRRDINGAYRVENKHNVSVLSLPVGDLGDSFINTSIADSKHTELDADDCKDIKILDEHMVEYNDDDLNEEGKGEADVLGSSSPLATVRRGNRATLIDKRHQQLMDPEARLKGDQAVDDQSQLDILAKCQVVYPSLMLLCHYSPSLRIGSHSVRDMLARLSEEPDTATALRKYNSKRFTYIYMDRATKSFGSYGGMVTAWDCGVSLVSTSHDESSLGTKINHGRFRSNDFCGYVLKDRRLSGVTAPPNPTILTLHVISGKDLVRKTGSYQKSSLNQSTESTEV